MTAPSLQWLEPLCSLEQFDMRAAYLAETGGNLPTATGVIGIPATYVGRTHHGHGGGSSLNRGRGVAGSQPDRNIAGTVVSVVTDPTDSNGRRCLQHSVAGTNANRDGESIRLDYCIPNDASGNVPTSGMGEVYVFGEVCIEVEDDSFDTLDDRVQFMRLDSSGGAIVGLALRRGASNYVLRRGMLGGTGLGSTITTLTPGTRIPYIVYYKKSTGANDGVFRVWIYTGGAWVEESSLALTNHTNTNDARFFIQEIGDAGSSMAAATIKGSHYWRGYSPEQFPFFASDELPDPLDFVFVELREPRYDESNGVGVSIFGYAPLGLVGNALGLGFSNLRLDLTATPVGGGTPIIGAIDLDYRNGGTDTLWGLTAGVQYDIEIEIAGWDSDGAGTAGSAAVRTIRTPPIIDPRGASANRRTWKVAEAGCFKQMKCAMPYHVLGTLRTQESPEIMFWLGDNGYMDSIEDTAPWPLTQPLTPAFDDETFEWQIRQTFWEPNRRALAATGCYNVYVFSDHDPGCANNLDYDELQATGVYMNELGSPISDAYPVGMTVNAYHLNGVAFLNDWFGAAMHGLDASALSNFEYWRTFAVGDMRVVILDTRFKQHKGTATEGGASFIGPEQRAWWDANFASWTEPLILLATEGPLSLDPNVQADNWRVFNTAECEAILDDLDSLTGRSFLFSNDRHCVTIRDDERKVEGRTNIIGEAIIGPMANEGYGGYDADTDPVAFDADAADGIVYSINHGGVVTGNPYARRVGAFEINQNTGALTVTVLDENASDVVWTLSYPAVEDVETRFPSTLGGDAADLMFPVAEGERILPGHGVGRADGYARPLNAGDPFLGFAVFREADNTDGLDGEKSIELRTRGYAEVSIAGVAQTNLGDKVYMSNSTTFTLTSSSNSLIGHIVGVPSSGRAIVRFELQPD